MHRRYADVALTATLLSIRSCLVLATTVSSDSSLATGSAALIPACFQPRTASNPLPSQISLFLTSASVVSYACDCDSIQELQLSNQDVTYYHAGALEFTSSRDLAFGFVEIEEECTSIFQTIIDYCIIQAAFWGGWVKSGNANWTVSNSIYPENPLNVPIYHSSTFTQSSHSSLGRRCAPASTKIAPEASATSATTIFKGQSTTDHDKIQDSLSAATRTLNTLLGSSSSGTLLSSTLPYETSGTSASEPLVISGRSSDTLGSLTGSSTKATTGSQNTIAKPPISLTELFSTSTFLANTVLSTSSAATALGAQDPRTASITASATTQTKGPISVVPDYSVADAFLPGLSQTTITASNGAVLIYSMQTLSGMTSQTGTEPVLIYTTIDQTDSHNHHTQFIGGIWVGPGRRFWGPPGVPKIEIKGGGGPHPIHIKPPCIWPFCSGRSSDDGLGGGDPEGEPPPPYEDPDEDPDEEKKSEEEQKTKKEHSKTEEEHKSEEEEASTNDHGSRTSGLSDVKTSLTPASASISLTAITSQNPSTNKYTTSRGTTLIPSSSSSRGTTLIPSLSSSRGTTLIPSSTSRSSFRLSTLTASLSRASSVSTSNRTITLPDSDYIYSSMAYTDALAIAASIKSQIASDPPIPDGPLWVPTNSAESADAAEETDPSGDDNDEHIGSRVTMTSTNTGQAQTTGATLTLPLFNARKSDVRDTESSTANICTPTDMPGRCGRPACHYYLAQANQVSGPDWCNCDGVKAPVLTQVISSTTSLNCNYTYQPTANIPLVNVVSTTSVSLPATITHYVQPVCEIVIVPANQGTHACKCTPGTTTVLKPGDKCGLFTIPDNDCDTIAIEAIDPKHNPINNEFFGCRCKIAGVLYLAAHIIQANDGTCDPFLYLTNPSCKLLYSKGLYGCDCSTWNAGGLTGPDVYNPCWKKS